MKKLSLLLGSLITGPMIALAVPAMPGLTKLVQPDGSVVEATIKGDEHFHYYETAAGEILLRDNCGTLRPATITATGSLEAKGTITGMATPPQKRKAILEAVAGKHQKAAEAARVAPNVIKQKFPTTGTVTGLILLVEYQDVKLTPQATKEHYEQKCNQAGYSSEATHGSVLDYFTSQSNGKFTPRFDVFGPITLPRERAYYGTGDNGLVNQFRDACLAADEMGLDFSKYDINEDGFIDFLFVVFAGHGEAQGGPYESVWPAMIDLSNYVFDYFDGLNLGVAACSCELKGASGTDMDGIGTICHEFSHILGLADIYDTSNQGGHGMCHYDIMDIGTYNDNLVTPSGYTAMDKFTLGWLDPIVLDSPREDVVLRPFDETHDAAFIVNPSNPDEYYTLENRQQQGCDKYLPGHGMLIWHVDYNATTWTQNTVNNDKSHQGVDLCEADGRDSKNQRTQGDAFPGSANVTRYQPRWWTGGTASIKLSGITETEGRISFAMEEAEAPGDYLSVYDVVNGTSNTTTNVKVRGYIVGYAKSTFTEKSVEFSAPATVESNIVLADSETETYYANCIPVQLMAASDARNALNLKTNPGMLGAYVELYGDLERYMLVNGLKSVREYTILSNGNVSIDEIETSADNNDNDNAEWFNLQGMRVSPESMSDGIYIRRTAKSAEKVTIKR